MGSKKKMKKLFIIYLCSIIVTFPVLSINLGQINVVSVPHNFPVELTNRILFDLAQNAHNYVHKADPFFTPMNEVKTILRTISILNKEWHKNLDKQRNDPVATRTMIQNIGTTCYSKLDNSFPPMGIIKQLCTPGAKKCISLSIQLYDNDLTVESVEQLYNAGAMLDYYDVMQRQTVLSYWVKRLNAVSIDIMRKLLELGANPYAYYECGDCSPLQNAMHHGNLKKNKLLLSYKAKKEWYKAFQNPFRRFIDLFIEYSTQDELNEGLTVCANNCYSLEIMQKLIDKGANPSVALASISEKVIKSIVDSTPDNQIAQQMLLDKFNFLCDQKAYDETVCNKVQNLQTIFSYFADKLEDNKPILNDNI